jgi:outer membrane lipoprotein-sorting protein
MKSLLFILAAGPLAATFVFQSPSAAVKLHADKMHAVPSVALTVSVTPIGGSPTEVKISALKPNMVRINTADKEVVTDGKTIWTYNKKASTYTEAPASENAASSLLGDDLWAWSAFFDTKFVESIATYKPGKVRKMKGFGIKEVDVTFLKRPNVSATILVDDQLSIARGFVWHVTDNGVVKDTIVFADQIELVALASASDFVFSPGRGVTKEVKPVSTGLVWKDVEPIFMGNCAGCHGARPSGGVRLTSYEGVMAGSRGRAVVVAGNPASSSILMNLKGQGKVMPPTGSMPAEVIAKIEQWITDGAKKE